MRRRYSSTHVGRTRLRLAEMIVQALGDSKNANPVEVKVDPSELVPVQGYWRIDHRADVYRWEGHIQVNTPHGWRLYQIYSWNTMSELLRGFEWKFGHLNEIELFATNARSK